MTAGRPTMYNDDIAFNICYRVSQGENIADICKSDNMPERSVINIWRLKHDEFADMYEKAVKCKADVKVDLTDEYIKKLENGVIDPQSANVIINTLKWQAAKFYPRMYSDKQYVESDNKNTNVNIEMPLNEADSAILARLGFTGDE